LTLPPSTSVALEANHADLPVLRLGLLVDNLVQPAWAAACLEEVLRRGDAQVALIVRNGRPPAGAPSGSRLAAWWRNRRQLGHALYSRLDALCSVARDPFAPRDISDLVRDVPVMDVVPRERRFSDYIEPDDVGRIRAHNLDVAVRFGFRILRGDVLRIARHGVWSYHHGDNRRYRGGPAGFWEVMSGDPVTGAVLQQLSEDLDAGQILFRAWSHSIPFSVRRNRAHYYWQSAPFLAWKLRDLRRYGPSGLPAEGEGRDTLAAYSQRIFTIPTNGEMIRPGAALAARYVRRRLRSAVTGEQWYLAYRLSPATATDTGLPDLVPCRFRSLIPPTDRFWADPFPYRADGTTWVFFEESINAAPPAHIAVMEFGPEGPIGPPRIALSTGSHLSYPFVFEYGGQHYMMPETAGLGLVQLWRAAQLPSEWVPDRVLIDDRPLVDATMALVNGRWWIWAAATASGGVSWDELHLYHSDSPLGPWLAHPRNPVVVDVRSARPAGRLFRFGGEWYRPAQDCSESYGGAMVIQRIERLDLQGYLERTVTRIDPTWDRGLVGTHTINSAGHLTVMDVRRRHLRWVP